MSSEVINLQTYYVKKADIINNLTTDDTTKPLSAKQGKALKTLIDEKAVTLTKLATATSGYIATYEIKQGGTSLGKIDIPKDYLVKSGSVKSVTTANSPVNGYAVGDKYIDFIINTKDSSGTDEHIYINVKDLVDTYRPATQSAAGLMSAADKQKLDAMASGGNTATDHNHDGQYIKTGTGTVTSTNIADKTIVNGDIADGTIESGKIKDGTIVNGDIANTTITGGKLVNGTVTATQLASNSVETAKIKDGAVTNAKLAGTKITASSSSIVDLNDTTYQKTGIYYCDQDAAAQYIIHAPWSNGTATPYTGNKGFFLLVEDWGTNNYSCKQTLTYYSGNNTYVRTKTNSTTWSAWKEFNTNNNDYLRLATRIISGESAQIPANRIIGGVTDSNNVGKYYIVASGIVLDMRYPLLYNTSAINSGSYTDNVYQAHTGVNLQNTVSGKTVTSQKQVYIEGTAYSNNKLTVSNNVFVSDDNLTNGNYYVYIGVSYDTKQIRFDTFNQIVYKKTTNGLVPVGLSYNDLTDKPSTFTPSSHTHGNITNAGAIGSTANLPIITDTNGVLKAGSFGTAANTFCQGNDSRLSNARTPTSHTHGNITNDGKIGSTATLPIITGTGGVLQAGSFGTTAGTFCQGNDSRLSNARTPTAHQADTNAYGAATTAKWGHTKLNSATNSTDETTAATPKAVKAAYDLANGKPSLGTTSTTAAKGDHNHDGTYLKSYTPPTASTSQAGIVQLEDSYSSTSTTKAATSNSVKAAYDKGNHSHPYISTTAGSVGASNLASNAVETAKIKDANVTYSKLGSDIEINGTNILTGTQSFSGNTIPTGATTPEIYRNCTARYIKNTTSSYIDFSWSIPYGELESNGYYTLSFWAKTTTAHNKLTTYFYSGNVNTRRIKSNSNNSSETGTSGYGDGSTYISPTTSWKRYYVVYQLNSTAPGTSNKTLAIRILSDTTNKPDIYLAGVKFEKGNIPTGWSPSPSDKASSSHNHSGTYVDGVGSKNSTDGSALAEIKANTTVKGTVYHPKVNTNALTGVPSANATLSHGGTFTVSQPVVNTDGHVTALNTRTYTLPSDNNTTYTASDGVKLDGTTFKHNSGTGTAQTTKSVYSIKFDKFGHINEATAVSSMIPSSHTHGNLQNNGQVQVGSTAVKNGIVLTDSSGKIIASKGSTANSTSVPQLYYYNGRLSIGG